MSSYRYRWYYYIKNEIKNSTKPCKSDTEQGKVFREALDKAIEQTKRLPSGEIKLKVITDILINQTKTCEGIAQELFYDRSTVARWCNDFVILVGKNAGY